MRPSTHRAPQQLILGVFASADRASEVRGALRQSERRELIVILDLVLARRDEDGRLELLQARNDGNRSDDRDSFPAFLDAILGAPRDGESSPTLLALADALPPGSSGIAALIEHRWLDDIRALMEEAGSDAVVEALRAEMASALGSGRDLFATAGAAAWRGGRTIVRGVD